MNIGADDPGDDKKSQILAVAEEIFGSKGYQATSMREIAERVSIQKPSLYHHFRNKDEIYRTLILNIYRQLAATIIHRVQSGESFEDKIVQFVDGLVDFWSEHPHFPRIIAREVIDGGELISTELIPKLWRPLFEGVSAVLASELGTQDEIGDVDLIMLFVHILGMTMFYFFTGPIWTSVTGEDSFSEHRIERLKQEIVKTVIQGVKKGE